MHRPSGDVLIPGIIDRKNLQAARIASASGVLNITGALIGGMVGNGRPLECLTSPSPFCAPGSEPLYGNQQEAPARIQPRWRM
jgi:hypothetical protein